MVLERGAFAGETVKEMRHSDLPPELNAITGAVVSSAIAVHSTLGAGLLERTYLACLAQELRCRDVAVETEVEAPVLYRGVRVHPAYRIDLVAGGTVLVELKAVTRLLPVHFAQVDTYLKLTGAPVGFLLNFNVPRMKHGIHRRFNSLAPPPPPPPPPPRGRWRARADGQPEHSAEGEKAQL